MSFLLSITTKKNDIKGHFICYKHFKLNVPFFPIFALVPIFPVPLFPVPFLPCHYFLCHFYLCHFYRSPNGFSRVYAASPSSTFDIDEVAPIFGMFVFSLHHL